MYEELIKQLRISASGIKSCDECNGECYGTCIFAEAADAIEKLNKDLNFQIRAARTEIESVKPQWIPVTERLPEKDIEVLVFAKGKIEGFFGDTVIAISKRYDFKMFTDFEGVEVWKSPWQYFLTDYEITHWMPLPPSP